MTTTEVIEEFKRANFDSSKTPNASIFTRNNLKVRVENNFAIMFSSNNFTATYGIENLEVLKIFNSEVFLVANGYTSIFKF